MSPPDVAYSSCSGRSGEALSCELSWSGSRSRYPECTPRTRTRPSSVRSIRSRVKTINGTKIRTKATTWQTSPRIKGSISWKTSAAPITMFANSVNTPAQFSQIAKARAKGRRTQSRISAALPFSRSNQMPTATHNSPTNGTTNSGSSTKAVQLWNTVIRYCQTPRDRFESIQARGNTAFSVGTTTTFPSRQAGWPD